jgi:type III secretory pathway component EscS
MGWLDSLTSLPTILAASVVGISAALFVRSRGVIQAKEQVKDTTNVTAADNSMAKMAQAVRHQAA